MKISVLGCFSLVEHNPPAHQNLAFNRHLLCGVCAPSSSGRAGAVREEYQARQRPPARHGRAWIMVEESQAGKSLLLGFGEM